MNIVSHVVARFKSAKLSPRDIAPGVKVIQTAHPEYGIWRIERENPPGTWEVSKMDGRGKIAVDADELLRFWELESGAGAAIRAPEMTKILVPVTEKLDSAEKSILVGALLKCLTIAKGRLTGREKAVAEKVILTEF